MPKNIHVTDHAIRRFQNRVQDCSREEAERILRVWWKKGKRIVRAWHGVNPDPETTHRRYGEWVVAMRGGVITTIMSFSAWNYEEEKKPDPRWSPLKKWKKHE